VTEDRTARLIAFYLPQFHPIPENDAWWGKGFTEWTNVAKARPLFPGHYQPHLPADLGYYDLRVPEVRQAQADLAKEHGIYGFCYYHYWFHGKRLLERPFDEVLASGQPDFPFCLCWANENWTRRWDGMEQEILAEQTYSLDDDRQHIRTLLTAFADRRYIRLDGRLLFLVYRATSLPKPLETTAVWREEVSRAGLGEVCLCTVSSLPGLHVDPSTLGFDAAVDFQPDLRHCPPRIHAERRYLNHNGSKSDSCDVNDVRSYSALTSSMIERSEPAYRMFPGVTPGWDNSPRRRSGATVYLGSTPDEYGTWLRSAIGVAQRRSAHGDSPVFINAWNEWAEGNHLEPDQIWGRAYLEATRNALNAASSTEAGAEPALHESSGICQWLVRAAEAPSGFRVDAQELATLYLQRLREAEPQTSLASPHEVDRVLTQARYALTGAHVKPSTRRAFAGWLLAELYFKVGRKTDGALVRWALPRLLVMQPRWALNLGIWSIFLSAALGESRATQLRTFFRRHQRRAGARQV